METSSSLKDRRSIGDTVQLWLLEECRMGNIYNTYISYSRIRLFYSKVQNRVLVAADVP